MAVGRSVEIDACPGVVLAREHAPEDRIGLRAIGGGAQEPVPFRPFIVGYPAYGRSLVGYGVESGAGH